MLHRYLNSSVTDQLGKEYNIVLPIIQAGEYQAFSTDSAHYIKIFVNGASNNDLKLRYGWISRLRDLYDLSEDLVFPNLLLNLQNGDYGYVTSRVIGGKIIRDVYCRPGKNKFLKWYFDETDGFRTRISSALLLIDCVNNIHRHGFCISDLSPDNIIQYRDENNALNVKILYADSLSSYSYPAVSNGIPGYMDPLVFNGINSVSTISDTYSLAITLFEILFGCHPFIGDSCIGKTQEEINELIDSGALFYIGDNSVEDNWNEHFEDIDLLFPDDVKAIFKKMFSEGKFDVYERPAISDLYNALNRMYLDVFKCHKCGREYLAKDMQCPFCRAKALDLLINFYVKTNSNQKFFLPLEDNVHDTVSNLKIVNSYVLMQDYTLNLAKDFLGMPDYIEEEGTLSILLSSVDKSVRLKNELDNFDLKIFNDDYADGRILSKGQTIKVNFQYVSKRRLELIPHNPKTKACFEFDNSVYGHVTQTYVLTIEMRNLYAQ